MTDLPIREILSELKAALSKNNRAVLTAPPGSGKTTVVPLELLDEPWLNGKKIIMLEPRRLAARAAAKRMSDTIGRKVGETVGYSVRMDSKVSRETRAEVLTEGILTRMLQADPSLEEAGLIIFDEFHERSVHADLGLALALETQEALREDLRILVMSATVDSGAISAFLGGCPVLSCGGKLHEVKTYHANVQPQTWFDAEKFMPDAVMRAFEAERGDILVFLPGEGEIKKLEAELKKRIPSGEAAVMPLYGNMPLAEQDAVLTPSPGRRKIVLATSVAETSLTIEGVRIVIDGGFSRASVYDPASAFSSLKTVKVTKAAADQRRGRAGRTGPGVCVRLWSEAEHAKLEDYAKPEILRADPLPLRLELAKWGAVSAADCLKLKWLDPPQEASLKHAGELLAELGALDKSGRVTKFGGKMLELPLHPRLAAMVLKSAELSLGRTACFAAALLSERDFVKGENSDVRPRLELLNDPKSPDHASFAGSYVDTGHLRRVRESALDLARLAGLGRAQDFDADKAGALLALAYPDRIGRNRKSEGRTGVFQLSGGGGAAFFRPDPLEKSDFIAAASLRDCGSGSKIFLAAPIDRREIEELFGSLITVSDEVAWDDQTQSVRAFRRRRFDALLLREEIIQKPDQSLVAKALIDELKKRGPSFIPWGKGALSLRARVNFLRKLDPARWPDFSDAGLFENIEEGLAPYISGVSRMEELRHINFEKVLESMLGYDKLSALNKLAPEFIRVPTGTNARLDYEAGDAPVMAVRIQEIFGVAETPSVAGGKVPVVLHLLSPAMRPAQITSDLKGFWQNSYHLVKKDLKGRYPKHYWPDNPLEAEPRKRGKPSPQ